MHRNFATSVTPGRDHRSLVSRTSRSGSHLHANLAARRSTAPPGMTRAIPSGGTALPPPSHQLPRRAARATITVSKRKGRWNVLGRRRCTDQLGDRRRRPVRMGNVGAGSPRPDHRPRNSAAPHVLDGSPVREPSRLARRAGADPALPRCRDERACGRLVERPHDRRLFGGRRRSSRSHVVERDREDVPPRRRGGSHGARSETASRLRAIYLVDLRARPLTSTRHASSRQARRSVPAAGHEEATCVGRKKRLGTRTFPAVHEDVRERHAPHGAGTLRGRTA